MKPLHGLRLLLVEDEYATALDLERMVRDLGAETVGPVGRLDQACALAEQETIDGAILDVRLDGETSLPLADTLRAQGIPVVLATGYDVATLPERFATAPKLVKPYVDKNLRAVTEGAFRPRPSV